MTRISSEATTMRLTVSTPFAFACSTTVPLPRAAAPSLPLISAQLPTMKLGTAGSFFIPDDWPRLPLRAANRTPNWQVIGQWHQQPRSWLGESWDDAFPGAGESPPIAFVYLYLDPNDPDYKRTLHDPRWNDIPGWDPNATGDYLMLTCGTPPLPIALHRLKRAHWNHIKIHIRWSQHNDGFVEAWLNNQPLMPGKHHGPNMWNEASHYFKFGLYRNPLITEKQIIYYDDLVIRSAK